MLRPSLLFLTATLLTAPAVAQPGAASAERQAVQAEQLFVRGMTRAYAGDYEDAVELYERALALADAEPAVLSALAEAHEALGEITTAIFYANRAAEAAPDEASTYRHLAGLQLASGDTDGALATYERLLEAQPRDVGALTALARIQQQSGRFAEALATYERVLARVGESASVRVRMLSIYQRLGDTAGAVTALEALAELDPANATVQRQLAGLYAETGRADEAIARLEAFLATRPDDAEARLLLAELYRGEGDAARADELLGGMGEPTASPEALIGQASALYLRADEDPAAADAARRLLETAVESGLADTRALLLLGDLRYRAGDWPGAAEALALALAEDPRNPPAWTQLVAAYVQAGDPDAALDAADEALLLFPGQYDLVRIAAIAHTEAQRNRDALRLFDDALAVLAEEEPDNNQERSTLLAYVGLLHARLGDDAQADAVYAEALVLDSDNAVALNNYAYGLLQRRTDLDKALEMAQRAVELEPESPSFLDTLGWAYYVREDFDRAAEWLTKAVEAGGRTAVILEHLGDAEAARGRSDAARRHWQAALELAPEREQLRNKLDGGP